MGYIDKKYLGIGAGILVVVIAFIGFFIHHNNTQQYDYYANVMTAKDVDAKSQAYSKSNKLEYDFIYKDGCKHCESVRKDIIDNVKKLTNSNNNYIIGNAAGKQLNTYTASNNITETPSIQIKYHGKVIIQYTGTNVKKLNDILSGINPENGATIKAQVPKQSTLINDFTKTTTHIPFYGN